MILLTVLIAVYVTFGETVFLKKVDEGAELIEFNTCVEDGDVVLVLLVLRVAASQPDADPLPVTLPIGVDVTN